MVGAAANGCGCLWIILIIIILCPLRRQLGRQWLRLQLWLGNNNCGCNDGLPLSCLRTVRARSGAWAPLCASAWYRRVLGEH